MNLKPCPFCGWNHIQSNYCTQCGASGPNHSGRPMWNWNMRTRICEREVAKKIVRALANEAARRSTTKEMPFYQIRTSYVLAAKLAANVGGLIK